MGMYDRIIMAGDKDALLCHAGHEIRDFQTKDLESSLFNFIVFDGLLYREVKEDSTYSYSLADGSVIRTSEKQFTPYSANDPVYIYTTCDECDPVYLDETFSYHGLGEAFPWVEYRLSFEGGTLEATAVKLESRDDVRQRCNKALPDNDPLVARELAKRNRE